MRINLLPDRSSSLMNFNVESKSQLLKKKTLLPDKENNYLVEVDLQKVKPLTGKLERQWKNIWVHWIKLIFSSKQNSLKKENKVGRGINQNLWI